MERINIIPGRSLSAQQYFKILFGLSVRIQNSWVHGTQNFLGSILCCTTTTTVSSSKKTKDIG